MIALFGVRIEKNCGLVKPSVLDTGRQSMQEEAADGGDGWAGGAVDAAS